MANELYLMTAAVTIIIVAGYISANKMKKKAKDKYSIISWYNHMIDQYVSIYQNFAEQYNEKVEIAEKYSDTDTLKRLHKLYDDTVRISERVEKKLDSLKSNIAENNFIGISFDTLFNDLKIVESYVAEFANIATLIRSIHPVNSFKDFGYEYERLTSHIEPANDNPWKASRFYSSCNTKEDLTKKYRELAKIYHPDNTTTGNEDSFKKLKAEYDIYLK
ncbi:MAG: hypothetical protein QM644_08010 [Mobilitalea sp.]